MLDTDEIRLLRSALFALREILPSKWEVGFDGGSNDIPSGPPSWLTIKSDRGGVSNRFRVEAKARVTPLAARTFVEQRREGTIWSPGWEPLMLVVSPWLSASTRRILRDGEVSYLDLTGNVFLYSPNPAVFIDKEGASRDPSATRGGQAQGRALSGTKAGRLVRLLVDAAPPVRPADLARKADLSPGYVARLLATLEDQGLIRRGHRGVDTVDWPSLLRARAEQSKSLIRPGAHIPLLAPQGVERFLDDARRELPDQTLVTGSYAAAAIAPVTVGGQLHLYPTGPVIGNPGSFATNLENLTNALPTERGADVLVLVPDDAVAVRWGAHNVDGLWHVAPSQLVLDGLTGNGRMPAEAEAVLDWMIGSEPTWRADSLDTLPRRYFEGQIHPGVQSLPQPGQGEQ